MKMRPRSAENGKTCVCVCVCHRYCASSPEIERTTDNANTHKHSRASQAPSSRVFGGYVHPALHDYFHSRRCCCCLLLRQRRRRLRFLCVRACVHVCSYLFRQVARNVQPTPPNSEGVCVQHARHARAGMDGDGPSTRTQPKMGRVVRNRQTGNPVLDAGARARSTRAPFPLCDNGVR